MPVTLATQEAEAGRGGSRPAGKGFPTHCVAQAVSNKGEGKEGDTS